MRRSMRMVGIIEIATVPPGDMVGVEMVGEVVVDMVGGIIIRLARRWEIWQVRGYGEGTLGLENVFT